MAARLVLLQVVLIPAFQASELSRGEVLQIRLLTPVCSHDSKAGDKVRAVVLGRADGSIEDELTGSELAGSVVSVTQVGIGIRHTKAEIRLWFDRLQMPGAAPVDLRATVIEVDNARETVDREGAVRGIDAGGSLVNRFTSRAVRLPSLNPYPDLALLTYKLVSPVFPDPEIHYPAGTEMSVMVKDTHELPDSGEVPRMRLEHQAPDGLEEFVSSVPARSSTGDGRNPADVVNLILVGDGSTVRRAFEAAGWQASDRRSLRTDFRTLFAVLEERGYNSAPMSSQTLGGEAPRMMWQKGLNNQRKRHHTRVWELPDSWQGRTMWAATATRDVGAGLSLRPLKIFHRIEANIDLERGKIARDLLATGCVDSVRWVERPALPQSMKNATGDEMTTDGRVAVVFFGECKTDGAVPAVIAGGRVKHGSVMKRWARKEILSLRYDLVKSNIIYCSFDAGRLLWRTFRQGDREAMTR